MRTTLTIIDEPRGAQYRALVELAAKKRLVGMLVVRNDTATNASCDAVLDSLRPHTIAQRDATEWPGTQLCAGGTATLHTVQLQPKCVDVLVRSVEGLYDWLHPDRPEDLCFLRPDGSPWLTSIVHEHDAYLTLTEQEHRELARAIPELRLQVDELDADESAD